MNRHASWSAVACAAALFACSPAWAQINKCVDARGKVSYQEQPCPGAKIERVIPAAPSQPAATPDPGSRESDARVRADASQRAGDRANCPQAFAEIEKARANMPNLRPAEQERLREVLDRDESMWKERCR